MLDSRIDNEDSDFFKMDRLYKAYGNLVIQLVSINPSQLHNFMVDVNSELESAEQILSHNREFYSFEDTVSSDSSHHG